MKGMGNVQEIYNAPPPGTYPVLIVLAEAGLSAAGNSQIVATIEITEGKFKGEQALDWIGTDPSAKGAGIGRGKLRVLLQGTQFQGLADAAESAEVPDAAIAQALVGQRLYAICDNSPRKRKDENGKRTTENMTQVDPSTGNLITIMNLDVKGYSRHSVGQTQQAPQTFAAPQPVQAAPQYAAQPAQPQYVQAAPQYAPQGGAPVQGFAPAGQPTLPFQPVAPGGAAVPPWQAAAPVNGAVSGEQAPAEGGRKPRGRAAQQQG